MQENYFIFIFISSLISESSASDKYYNSMLTIPPSRAEIGASSSQSFFLKGAQVGGRTWELFDFRLFSLTIAAH